MAKAASEPMKEYRVLVADDHAVVRHGVRALLETQPGIVVCCEAATGTEALEMVLPEKNGLEVARVIREEAPATEVLILTMHFSEEVAREVLRCGARGFVLKSDADIELINAVRQMQQHKPFFTGKLAMSMADSFVRDVGDPEEEAAGCPLSTRELEVAQLLAAGKSNKEAAGMLGVSSRTVESHRNHIMHKMGFTCFSDIVRFAIRNNLIEP